VIKPSSLQEVKEAIAQLEAVDLKTVSIDELKKYLTPVFKGWKLTAPIFDPGVKVFRARLQTQPPVNLKQMSYPPGSAMKADGRVSRQGKPVFYGCGARNAVFFENPIQEGDLVAITHYETTARLPLMRVGYTPEVFQNLKSKRELPDYGTLNVDAYSSQEKLINDFLSSAFSVKVSSGEEWRYRMSVAISEKFLIAEMVEGLLYPSVAMWAHADNIALKPRFADRHLRPLHAEFVRITGINGSEVTLDSLDEARTFGAAGEIHWLGHKGKWKIQEDGGMLVMEFVDGHYVAKDRNGRIVDPK
jgi:hypothetical protein